MPCSLFFLYTAILSLVTPMCAAAGEDMTLSGSPGGRVHLSAGEQVICSFAPAAANAEWVFSHGIGKSPLVAGRGSFEMSVNDLPINGGVILSGDESGATAQFDFTAKQAVDFQTLVVATEFAISELAGGRWEADGTVGEFPSQFGKAHLFIGTVQRLDLELPSGRKMALTFPAPTMVVLQDNRQWGTASFTLRVGRGAGRLEAGETFSIAMTIPDAHFSETLPLPLRPVVLRANEEWIPLKQELEIEQGSALDLSGMGFVDGPCGTKGRVIVSPEGHFAYADEPERPKRFYGVNFCFSAQYLPKAKVDRLLDRVLRLGYNTVRIHHYEVELTQPSWRPGFDWDPKKVDQLDYLLAGCAKRGLWVSTDLYVSRPVSGEQIGRTEKEIPMDMFKILVPVSEQAFQDWAAFSRRFLDRVNPYTGTRLADDPAIAWISLINEGPLSNNWDKIREMPEWKAAWNAWLQERFSTRSELEAALGDLAPSEDPANGSVRFAPSLFTDEPRALMGQAFVAEKELATFERMRDFLRKDLKCQALLTNMNNAGPGLVSLQLARQSYDYVDEHFYVDHPHFLEKPWQLPSSSPNANPITSGASGGVAYATVRLFGKPFTITEYNYSGPGRFRGVGGILTGALGALQNWDGMWRFAYSHDARNLFHPAPMGYFDLAGDPLNLAADRLTLFLYLRRDLTAAPAAIATLLSEKDLRNPIPGQSVSPLRSAAWLTRVGSIVTRPGETVPSKFRTIPANASKAVPALRELLTTLGLSPTPAIRSETGQITVDPKQTIFIIDSPKSAGGYADPGKSLSAPSAGVQVDELTMGATVFINSLDESPIRSSRRLLVTHLTDLQNTDIRYGEGARQTLLDWGELPHLVRDGSARISMKMERPGDFTVWALSVGGRRVEKVPSIVKDGKLTFVVSVKGSEGARLLYEIATEKMRSGH